MTDEETKKKFPVGSKWKMVVNPIGLAWTTKLNDIVEIEITDSERVEWKNMTQNICGLGCEISKFQMYFARIAPSLGDVMPITTQAKTAGDCHCKPSSLLWSGHEAGCPHKKGKP